MCTTDWRLLHSWNEMNWIVILLSYDVDTSATVRLFHWQFYLVQHSVSLLGCLLIEEVLLQMTEQVKDLETCNGEMEETLRLRKATLDLLPDAANNIARLEVRCEALEQWEALHSGCICSFHTYFLYQFLSYFKLHNMPVKMLTSQLSDCFLDFLNSLFLFWFVHLLNFCCSSSGIQLRCFLSALHWTLLARAHYVRSYCTCGHWCLLNADLLSFLLWYCSVGVVM